MAATPITSATSRVSMRSWQIQHSFWTRRRAQPSTAAEDAAREYTCPMDPEVRQLGPGPCPKCGMALEPVDIALSTRVEWTCPMHPEIIRDAPGTCPICGMALEPRTVTLEEKNPELEDMTRRFWRQHGADRADAGAGHG